MRGGVCRPQPNVLLSEKNKEGLKMAEKSSTLVGFPLSELSLCVPHTKCYHANREEEGRPDMAESRKLDCLFDPTISTCLFLCTVTKFKI